ncbi:MAG: hypothetical protein WBK75_00475 [Acutalibacteraceae bacterium]
MKDRDRRKLHATLILLASIFVAVATALSITFIALGALIVYVRKNFLVWNEKRKAENAERKEQGIEKKEGLLDKIKSKFGKKKTKNVDESSDFVNVSSAGYNVRPVEFDKIQYPQEEVEVTGSNYLENYEESVRNISDAKQDAEIPKFNDYENSNQHQFGTASRFKGIQF